MRRFVLWGLALVFLTLGAIVVLRKNKTSDLPKSKKIKITNAKKLNDTIPYLNEKLKKDTIWLKISASKTEPFFLQIGGKLKNGNVPFEEGSYFQKNKVLRSLDLADLFASISKLKLNLREALLNTLGSNALLQSSDLFLKWNGFLNAIDISHKLPEFPEIYDAEEEQIIRKSEVPKLFVMCQQLEKNTNQYFLLSKEDGFVWSIKKKPGEQVNANEIIFSTVRKTDITFTISNINDVSLSEENYTLFDEKGTELGSVNLVKSKMKTFKISSLTKPSKGLSPSAKYFIKQDGDVSKEK